MRLVLQRVSRAEVRVAGEVVGRIGRGLVVLVGVERGDDVQQVAAAARKMAGMRVFEDADGRMNLDPRDAGASFLVISQFTLAGSLAKGRRPSFDRAAKPDDASLLVDSLVQHLRHDGFEVAEGRFGAHMEVDLVNDGPVTLVLDVGPDGKVVGRG